MCGYIYSVYISICVCIYIYIYIGPTGAGEKLLDLLVLWHILDGNIDLLPDLFHCILPFQVTVTSVQQPVCGHRRIQRQWSLWIHSPVAVKHLLR